MIRFDAPYGILPTNTTRDGGRVDMVAVRLCGEQRDAAAEAGARLRQRARYIQQLYIPAYDLRK